MDLPLIWAKEEDQGLPRRKQDNETDQSVYTSLSLATSADERRIVRQRTEIDKVYTVRWGGWRQCMGTSVNSGDSLPVSSSCVISFDLRLSAALSQGPEDVELALHGSTAGKTHTHTHTHRERERERESRMFRSIRTNIRIRSRRRPVPSKLAVPARS